VVEIPCDYDGVMGVPITFIFPIYYNKKVYSVN